MDEPEPKALANIEGEFAALVSRLVSLREAERQAAMGDGMRFLITRVLSYKIEIRPREEGHNHPHFHVSSPDYEGSYRIDTLQCIIGNVPRRHEKEIQKWADKNKPLLEASWKRAHPVSLEQKRTVIE
jgi:hypothetical protein